MSQNSKKYTAVIIGAGRIAAGFDNPQSPSVLTHAHAYKNNSKLELAGLYDIDFSKAKKAAKIWSTRAFKSLAELHACIQPDIVSVCTPDNQHFHTLKQSISLKPRLVIAEKPLTDNLKDSQKIIALCRKEKIPVLVNYSRRFDVTVQKIKSNLERGQYGKVLAATGIYGKGVLHNGSHMVDLARYFFGEAVYSQPLFSRSDYDNPRDPSIGGFLSFDRCPQFYLIGADERSYSIFELDMVCEKVRLRFTDSGLLLSEQKTVPDPMYKGYTILSKSKDQPSRLLNAMAVLVDNAVKFLDKKQPLISTLDNAYKTQVVCSELLKK